MRRPPPPPHNAQRFSHPPLQGEDRRWGWVSNYFPGCTHIELLGMRGIADAAVWNYARENGYTIVSKDNDFRQRAFLHGAPPKIVWLSIGNAGTMRIAALLRAGSERLRRFELDPGESLLVIQAQSSA